MLNKEELLKQYPGYKQSNKTRRASLLKKWGFASEERFYWFIGISAKVKKIDKPVKEKKGKNKDSNALDYVIAFDCTGSMSSYIKSVKNHIVDLLETMFKNTKDLQIKIVAFGDYCDMESSTNFGIAYQQIELTNNQNELVHFVVNAENTNGGDGDEFYELVMNKINQETKWRKNAKKAVLLIADAKPHGIGYSCEDKCIRNTIDWKEQAKEASRMSIQYDTLNITPYAEKWLKEVSAMTNGINMDFKNANKISDIIEGATYARSSRASFSEKYSAVMDSADSELIGAYKSLSTLTDKK